MNTLHLLCLVVLSLALLGSYVCSSEPQQYYGDADDISEPTEEQRMMINKQFQKQLLRSLGQLRDEGNLKRLMAQKRFATDRQTRGGVALCLWKVCPAGPWLVQK
ncbi:uncharacterized protein LOC111136570 [Crassostrea virginica]|uniref:Uncharacterized protein LOC111136570 n=1 Tax=Crassostrea virginica TaxID=6565 RepID=A0A8B8EU38_CRAVI|nr:uncharacterized protein LOC111136570 [Crassostrea virginica]